MPDFNELVKNLYISKGRELTEEKLKYIDSAYGGGKEEEFVKNFYSTIGEELTEDKFNYIRETYLKKKEPTTPPSEIGGVPTSPLIFTSPSGGEKPKTFGEIGREQLPQVQQPKKPKFDISDTPAQKFETELQQRVEQIKPDVGTFTTQDIETVLRQVKAPAVPKEEKPETQKQQYEQELKNLAGQTRALNRDLQIFEQRGDVQNVNNTIKDFKILEANAKFLVNKYPEVYRDIKNQEWIDNFYREHPVLETGVSAYNSLIDAVKTAVEFPSKLVIAQTEGLDLNSKEAQKRLNIFDDFVENNVKFAESTEKFQRPDGSLDWSKFFPAIGETVGTMAALIGGARVMGGGNAGLFASSYILTRDSYYKQAREKGLDVNDANSYADAAAGITSLLELVSPNPALLKGINKSGMLDDYVKALAGGRKEAAKTLTKNIITKEILPENAQEIMQLYGDKITQSATDMATGQDVFNPEYADPNELISTVALTSAATLLMSGGAMVAENATLRKNAEVTLAKDLDATRSTIDNMLANGQITEQQAQNVFSRAEKLNKAIKKIPSTIKPERVADTASLLEEKETIQSEIEGKDPALVEPQKQRIEQINNELKNIADESLRPTDEGRVTTTEERIGEPLESGKGEPTQEDVFIGEKIDDTKDKAGLPSEVGIRQEPIQAEPIKEAGISEIAPSGVLETDEKVTPQAGSVVGEEVESRKIKQLEIINKENPAPNNYNTWVRNLEDIKTADEVFEVAKTEGAIYPDFTEQDMEDALSKGEVVVYSSYPIKNGVFVSPSKMNAQDFAGGKSGKVYSKVVKLEDVAWIDEGQGQYAKVEQSLQSTPQAEEAVSETKPQLEPEVLGKKRVYRAEQIANSLGGKVVGSATRVGAIPNDFDIYIENKIDFQSMKNKMESLGYKFIGASPVVDAGGKQFAGENQTAFHFINNKGQRVDVFQEETNEDYSKRVSKPQAKELEPEVKSNLEKIEKETGVSFREVQNVYNKYGEGKPLNEITAEDYRRAEAKRQAEKEPTEKQIADTAQKAGVTPKNLRDLYKINRELFGLDRIKSLASAIAMDRMVGLMAKRAGITKEQMYGRLKFEKKTDLSEIPFGIQNMLKFQAAMHGSPYVFPKEILIEKPNGEQEYLIGTETEFPKVPSGYKLIKEFPFGRFKTEKIGTGEGAQAFGWGLYFTDLESIARGYAKPSIDNEFVLNGVNLRGKIPYNLLVDLNTLIQFRDKPELFYGELKNFEKRTIESLRKYAVESNNEELYNAFKYIDSFNDLKFNRNLYKVTLHKGKTPDQYTWLEWDKPVSEIVTEKLGDILDTYLIGNGKEVYTRISQKLGGDKQASLFLLENGIDGIKYPAESIARGATSDTARGFNYVVFDENAVSIEEVIKFQKDAEKARGAMMISMDGQAVIYALTDPNVSTPLHEMAHVFEHYMTDAEKAIVQSWAGTKGWTTQTSEKFARGFEKYLAEGKAPTSGLQKIFDKFKTWLTDIYNGITGSDIDIELNEPMREIYAQMLGAEAVKPAKVEPELDVSEVQTIAEKVIQARDTKRGYDKQGGRPKPTDMKSQREQKAQAILQDIDTQSVEYQNVKAVEENIEDIINDLMNNGSIESTDCVL